MAIPSKTASYLEKNKIKYDVVPHKKVFTAYDLAQTTKTKLESIAKTLLVKADGVYRLVLVRASDRIDLKKLQKILAAKKLSIANEKDMVKTLKVKPGALTPFAGLHKITAVVDRALGKQPKALFGSGSFEHSIHMKTSDYLKTEKPVTGSFGVSAKLKMQIRPKR